MNMDINISKTSVRGANWFNALTQNFRKIDTGLNSVLAADGMLGQSEIRVIAIVPDAHNIYPRSRHGEAGLLEGWTLSRVVDDVIQVDQDKENKRSILAIVDVPSQAYGRREELLGIHQALAGAVDSYVRARLAKHPVISLLVGKSMSGAFLAHGYQANRIIALDDQGVMVHAMGKESAARVTLRTVEEMEQLAASIAPMAYDLKSYASLGLLSDILTVSNPENPNKADVQKVIEHLLNADQDIRQSQTIDLKHRLNAPNRQASKYVRQLLREQW